MGCERLEGKVAVITGAAQGLGEALARRLDKEGCKVVIGDINIEKAIEVAKSLKNAVAVRVDVTDEESVEALMNTAVENYGRVDITVSNAAVLVSGATTEFDVKKWQFVINVNLVGYFIVAKAAARKMLENGGGSIIQINSKSGKKGSFKNSAYAASKFGGIGLTQSLALEFAKDNIRVNAICPGNLLNSPLWVDSLFKQYALNQGITEQEVRQKYLDQVPMGRSCEYEDVANVMVFLASEESSYMTGQAVNVTGGQQMS
ncbi:MAG: sorbitol-6-phosphate dehydrogenase [Clostridia bacterium]|nr:sorbitol-6-phosphate dehydrogenase [Clostridia bacterium]